MEKSWVERKFDFDFDFKIYLNFIERLAATPDVLDILILSIPEKYYQIKNGKEWSIQENVGHLLSVDDLFMGRLDDYERGASELRPADVSGTRTEKEDFNSGEMKQLLRQFREKRMIFVGRLDQLSAGMFKKVAWHPRLKKPMRLCDMLYFQAEHDDHHLHKIRLLEDDLRETC